ncbi:estradiol 17-beta-dehydrogenase 12-A [Viridothelium virens]|uniref:Estradiol 17-beta-dehydrogenase 12-A n=1 Tax=Viridothelium virens TaxID=1048519 RepID=A0A6A6HP99_VIRVR|nr:estradiol 17-beta-dehydrogenase 12-A [Viridothelium virens]
MDILTTILVSLLSFIGTITLAILLYHLATFITLYARPSSLPRYLHPGPSPSWALVTGATDGIGLALAQELLSHGFAVLLHGRDPSKLSTIQHLLQRRFPSAQLSSVCADAAACHEIDFAALRAHIDALERSGRGRLTMLVNNVGGVNYAPILQELGSMRADDLDRTLNLNARFPTRLTHALLPVLAANAPSLVLNVGSMTGVIGAPYLGSYTASKAYANMFSASLATECEIELPGVEVLGLLIGVVRTRKQRLEANLFTPDAETLARAALKRVGCGRRVVNAYFWHAVQASMVRLMPESVLQGWVKKTMKEQKAKYRCEK